MEQQAAAEEAFLAELGDSVCAKLALHSRVTLRNGNGLIDRWISCQRMRATSSDDPLLPPAHKTAAETPYIVADVQRAAQRMLTGMWITRTASSADAWTEWNVAKAFEMQKGTAVVSARSSYVEETQQASHLDSSCDRGPDFSGGCALPSLGPSLYACLVQLGWNSGGKVKAPKTTCWRRAVRQHP